MLRPEDNELLCRVGPGTPMGELFRRFWIPAMIPEELPKPEIAIRYACACSERTSSPSATQTAGLVSSTRNAPTAGLQCTSDATRNAGCVASITAGNSTSTAIALKCQMSRPRPTSSTKYG